MSTITFNNDLIQNLESSFKTMRKNKNFKGIGTNDQYASRWSIVLDAAACCKRKSIEIDVEDDKVTQCIALLSDFDGTAETPSGPRNMYERSMLRHAIYFQTKIAEAMRPFVGEIPTNLSTKKDVANIEKFDRTYSSLLASTMLFAYEWLDGEEIFPYIEYRRTHNLETGERSESFNIISNEAELTSEAGFVEVDGSDFDVREIRDGDRVVMREERQLFSLQNLVTYANDQAHSTWRGARFDAGTKSVLEAMISKNVPLFSAYMSAVEENIEAMGERSAEVITGDMALAISARKAEYAEYGIPSFLDYLGTYEEYKASPSYNNDAVVKFDRHGNVKTRKNPLYYTEKEYTDFVTSPGFKKYVREMLTPVADDEGTLTMPVEQVFVPFREYVRLSKLSQTDEDFPASVNIQLASQVPNKALVKGVSLVLAVAIPFVSIGSLYAGIGDGPEKDDDDQPDKPTEEQQKPTKPVINPSVDNEEEDTSSEGGEITGPETDDGKLPSEGNDEKTPTTDENGTLGPRDPENFEPDDTKQPTGTGVSTDNPAQEFEEEDTSGSSAPTGPVHGGITTEEEEIIVEEESKVPPTENNNEKTPETDDQGEMGGRLGD